MITVTRRNGEKVHINPTNLEMVEQHEDSLITIVGGKKIIVVEKVDEINRQLLEWWRSIFKVNNR